MSRLYLVLLFCLFSAYSIGQVKTNKLVEFADSQYIKGDFYYAIDYYQQALKQDSNNIEIQWKYAEAQRAYKNYKIAEEVYAKVYARDDGKNFPACILQLGLMQKQNGNYNRAFETFKLAKRKYEKNKNDFLYKKAVQEIDATAWAINNNSDKVKPLISLPETVNSLNAEFGHIIHEKQLIFSSLRADSINELEEVFGKKYKTHLFSSKIENGEFIQNERINELFDEKSNAGNGTFSLDGKRFYFSNCKDENFNYTCKILVSNYENGSWSQIDTLGNEINEPGKNSTMPFVTRFEGKEVMFFCSNKSGTKGGPDIWMAQMDANKGKNIVNLTDINTIENDISPWFDTTNQKLYFSSTWHYGFGGQDIFCSEVPFKNVQNLGLPINSPANDQYFFIHNDTNYISSNRLGSRYAKNPTCCSDIFVKYPDKILSDKPSDSLNTASKIKNKLPIRLYFRNDEPDEDSWAVTTKQNYLATYELYKENYELYKREVGNGFNLDISEKKQQELDDFFKNDVDGGAADLIDFTRLLLQELVLGSKIIVSVKGFASPLAKTDYNVNLTKRRISSLVNYFNEYNHGEFLPYLQGTDQNGGKLILEFIPFGEYCANQKTSDQIDNPKESVFSKEAGIERKLHIEEVTFEKNKETFPLFAKEFVHDAGVIHKVNSISGVFTILNRSNSVITYSIINSDSNLSLNTDKLTIEPNEIAKIKFKLNTSDLKGFHRNSFQLEVSNFENKLELFITTEVK